MYITAQKVEKILITSKKLYTLAELKAFNVNYYNIKEHPSRIYSTDAIKTKNLGFHSQMKSHSTDFTDFGMCTEPEAQRHTK